ncbi:MAG: tripartite tricarboxylate transporter TctB family protein [Thermodesulfobacteriota bacterium]
MVKAGLLLFFLILILESQRYPEQSRLYPNILCSVAVILIVASFIQDFIRPKGKKKKEDQEEPELPPLDIREQKLRWVKQMEAKSERDAGYELLEEGLRKRRLRQSILIILISLVIGYLGGFLLTVPFYFIAFGILHGQKKGVFKYIIIAFGITVITYLFFTSLMGVPMLRGLLWNY